MRSAVLGVVAWLAACDVTTPPVDLAPSASDLATSTPDLATTAPLAIDAVEPRIVDTLGHSRVVLTGVGLLGATSVSFGGIAATSFVVESDTRLRATTPALPLGTHPVRVNRGAVDTTRLDEVVAWSPVELADARVFDSGIGIDGVDGAAPARSYEWAERTHEIAPTWRWRDGNTLDWLPGTGKFWMVAGWNGEAPPLGFDYVDPALGLTPHPTTNEVWSSTDGISWTLELPDDHPGFDRRHSHSSMYWRDRLWIIGGDWWRHAYNHDVVSSSNGVDWTIEVAQTPWEDRALHVAGVYADKLWMVGGQKGHGLEAEYVYHNDVWSSDDGVHWTEVLPDGPASATRWAPRGMVNNLVEWHGRMWLVGGGTYTETLPRTMYPEVWSTTDGVTWQEHTAPPWVERQWHNVVVFDDRLWVLMGYSDHGGNLADAWYSDDGETWTMLPAPTQIAPGSHAQGVAVGPDFLLYAGGNYSYGTGAINDKSAWRLRAFRGVAAATWHARDGGAAVTAAEGARPIWDQNAFAPGVPGLQFDSTAMMQLATSELQPNGRSVFWIARAPALPEPIGWDEAPTVNPQTIVVGDGDGQSCAVGYGGGDLYYTGASALGWQRARIAADVRRGESSARLVGFTHDASGALRAYVDGLATGEVSDIGYSEQNGWSRIGSGYGDAPSIRLIGTLGAVIVLPYAVDEATVAQLHAWAKGRFGVK